VNLASSFNVSLSTYEMMIAAEVGKMRMVSSIKSGYENQHGMPSRNWDADIEGAAGEMAVAKALGLYWDCSVNSFKKPDLPFRIQVRTTHQKSLIVRPSDTDDDRFVLVRGYSPRFEIVGWILGREAKKQEWMAAPNGRPAAHFVPSEALRSPGTLLLEVIS